MVWLDETDFFLSESNIREREINEIIKKFTRSNQTILLTEPKSVVELNKIWLNQP